MHQLRQQKNLNTRNAKKSAEKTHFSEELFADQKQKTDSRLNEGESL